MILGAPLALVIGVVLLLRAAGGPSGGPRGCEPRVGGHIDNALDVREPPARPARKP